MNILFGIESNVLQTADVCSSCTFI